MKYSKLVIPVLALSMVMAGCSKKTEETTAAPTEETTTAAETTTEDVDWDEGWEEDEEFDDECPPGWSQEIPDQSMEIDENYMKYYDYEAFYALDFSEEEKTATEADITDDALKEDFKKFVDDGYKMYTADEQAKYLMGEGFVNEDTAPIAYLYRGFTAYKETPNSVDTINEYLVPQEIIDKMPYVKVEEKDGIIVYEDDEAVTCPREGEITYDPSTQILKVEIYFEFEGGAVG